MNKGFISILAVLMFCAPTLFAQDKKSLAKAKDEILAAEVAFCNMAKEKSIEEAILAYAAEDAVICRPAKIYKGKQGIHEFYARKDKNDKLI